MFISLPLTFLLFAGKKSLQDYWPTKSWRTSSPEKQGIDAKQLKQINDSVREELLKISSVLVVRNGYIVFEEYYSGNENDLRTLWSATKSITSALIGIVLKKGNIDSIDQKLVSFFPDYVEEDTDPQFNKITIRHLLTMTAGFSRSFEGLTSLNPIKSAFRISLDSEPGINAAYNSTASHLLSGIINKTTGLNALEFGKKYLFEPLGIYNMKWDSDPQGNYYGGYGLQLSSRDMVKIGYLHLKNGKWDKKQILTEEWVKESTQKQSEGGLKSYNRFINESYGYQWWVTSIEGHSAYYAFGGGPFIYIINDLNVIIVITSDSWNVATKNKDIIERLVVPAIRE